MFLSRAIPSAIRMISGFGISFRPLCYSVLYSVVPITTLLYGSDTRRRRATKRPPLGRPTVSNEPVSQEAPLGALIPDSSGIAPPGSGIEFPARWRRPRPMVHAVAYASAWMGSLVLLRFIPVSPG